MGKPTTKTHLWQVTHNLRWVCPVCLNIAEQHDLCIPPAVGDKHYCGNCDSEIELDKPQTPPVSA